MKVARAFLRQTEMVSISEAWVTKSSTIVASTPLSLLLLLLLLVDGRWRCRRWRRGPAKRTKSSRGRKKHGVEETLYIAYLPTYRITGHRRAPEFVRRYGTALESNVHSDDINEWQTVVTAAESGSTGRSSKPLSLAFTNYTKAT